MFGLVVLAVAALYFSVMFVAVRWAWRREIREGGTRGEAFRKALFVFLLIYLPVFWDHIPTLVVHRAMCAKDAGFTAYVDAKQWHEKNAEAVAAVNRLPRIEQEAYTKLPHSSDGFERYVDFGGLLRQESRHNKIVPWLPVGRSERRIADARTGQVLAAAIDYSAGSSRPEYLKWWNNIDSCVTRPASSTWPLKNIQPEDFLRHYQHLLLGGKP